MAFVHGSACEVIIDGSDLTELFRSASVSSSFDTRDTTTFRKTWKTHTTGQLTGTASLEGIYDVDTQEVFHDRLAVATPVLALIGPGGLAVGSQARLLEVNGTSYGESDPVGDLVSATWELTSQSEIGYGYSLANPTTVLTADGNGVAVDLGAAVAGADWIAHLHLTSLDDTGVTISIEHSVNGSTSWAVLASDYLMEPGAVRLTGNDDVRRYVRAVVAFDSGTGVNSTIAVGFARR